jgi:hypothetical protein
VCTELHSVGLTWIERAWFWRVELVVYFRIHCRFLGGYTCEGVVFAALGEVCGFLTCGAL